MAFALKKHPLSTRTRLVWTGINAIQVNKAKANIRAEKSTKFVQRGSFLQMKKIGIFPPLRLNLSPGSDAVPASPQGLMHSLRNPEADAEDPKKMSRATDAHPRRH